jgi:molybdate transport system permease protein
MTSGLPLWWAPLGLNLKVATLATLVALFAGLAAAYALKRWRFPGRELVDAICTLPLVMPPTVLGYYLLVLIGRRGLIGQWLQETFGITLMFTWQGAVLAAALVAFPLVFKSARAALEEVGRGHWVTVSGAYSGDFRHPHDHGDPRCRGHRRTG